VEAGEKAKMEKEDPKIQIRVSGLSRHSRIEKSSTFVWLRGETTMVAAFPCRSRNKKANTIKHCAVHL